MFLPAAEHASQWIINLSCRGGWGGKLLLSKRLEVIGNQDCIVAIRFVGLDLRGCFNNDMKSVKKHSKLRNFHPPCSRRYIWQLPSSYPIPCSLPSLVFTNHTAHAATFRNISLWKFGARSTASYQLANKWRLSCSQKYVA